MEKNWFIERPYPHEKDISSCGIIGLINTDGRRVPGNLIRDAIGGMRFEGEQARTIEFYDPSDLRRRSVTVYVMGVDVPGVDQVRYMAFARDIPRLPWRVEGTEGWRRWLSLWRGGSARASPFPPSASGPARPATGRCWSSMTCWGSCTC